MISAARVGNIYKYRELSGAVEARSNGIRYNCPCGCRKIFWHEVELGDVTTTALPTIRVDNGHWSGTLTNGLWERDRQP
jgi:hypothetical protein